jgi:hypothetical protein
VSKDKLTRLLDDQRTYINEKFEEMMQTVNNLVTQIEHVEQRPPPRQPQHQPPEGEEEEDHDADLDAGRLQRNHHGMGGNHNRGNNDPFAKTKFAMIPITSTANPKAYLDWELAVEQKINSHLVPAGDRIRLATSELVLLYFGGMTFALLLIMLMLYLRLGIL